MINVKDNISKLVECSSASSLEICDNNEKYLTSYENENLLSKNLLVNSFFCDKVIFSSTHTISNKDICEAFDVNFSFTVDEEFCGNIHKNFYKNQLMSIIENDYCIPGEESKTGIFLSENLSKDKSFFMEILQEIYLESFNKLGVDKDFKIAINIIYALSQCDYEDVYPQAPLMLMNTFTLKDDEVKEYALRAFENWENPDMLGYLSQIRNLGKKWLDDYLKKIIEDLEEIKKGND